MSSSLTAAMALKTGVLIAAGDVEAWTEGLAWALIKPDAMRAMAAAGREDVLARFSVDSNVARFLEFHRRLTWLNTRKIGYAWPRPRSLFLIK